MSEMNDVKRTKLIIWNFKAKSRIVISVQRYERLRRIGMSELKREFLSFELNWEERTNTGTEEVGKAVVWLAGRGNSLGKELEHNKKMNGPSSEDEKVQTSDAE